MKRTILLSITVCLFISSFTSADTFGTGVNQFELAFVTISGDASSANGTIISSYGGYHPDVAFEDPQNDFRMGQYEITNDQWNKFKTALGVPVTGSQIHGYRIEPDYTAANVPTNNVSWYEAAQFVNWLNTSTGHQAAYKFTGTQGTGNYTFALWDVTDAGYDASNPFRNDHAYYFLPTDGEWAKAAYWNGGYLQQYATKAGESVYQGNGSNGGWNFFNGDFATDPAGPWDVGSGSEELNGTFDMMGNVTEWLESPGYSEDLTGIYHGNRGGDFWYFDEQFGLSLRGYSYAYDEMYDLGFRVASVPEPATMMLLAAGGLALLRKRT